jgi:maleylpyruvate isomerase
MFRVHAAHRRLVTELVSLTDQQVKRPSLLPDWTVGHVLSHIALNAEAFVRVADGLRNGETGAMYPSMEVRNAAIEAGAQRGAEEIRAHIDSSAKQFEEHWSTLTDDQLKGLATTVPGMPTFAANEIVVRRLREVEVHHADAGLPTFSFADWSEAYVDVDFSTQLAGIAARLGRSFHAIDENGEHHLSGDGAIDVEPTEIDRRTLLAWCFNRIEIAELPDLGSWQTPTPPK